jgi:hypothetical protein
MLLGCCCFDDSAITASPRAGIGFKAIFMIADTAYIASSGYTFQFDRNRKLGMMIPNWVEPSDMPMACRPTGTTMHFQFNSKYRAPEDRYV